MSRAARERITYAPSADHGNAREYVVGVRAGSATWTTGRVMGSATFGWQGLGIGARAWTSQHRTRAAAIADMVAGRDWIADECARHMAAQRADDQLALI